MFVGIGETARRCGCSVQTLRYYQDLGLLEPARRTAGGQRLYDEAALQRARFIRAARSMGFGLGDIAKLLALDDANGTDCEEIRALARSQLLETEKRLEELRQLQALLKGLVAGCPGGSPADCQVLSAIRGNVGE